MNITLLVFLSSGAKKVAKLVEQARRKMEAELTELTLAKEEKEAERREMQVHTTSSSLSSSSSAAAESSVS